VLFVVPAGLVSAFDEVAGGLSSPPQDTASDTDRITSRIAATAASIGEPLKFSIFLTSSYILSYFPPARHSPNLNFQVLLVASFHSSALEAVFATGAGLVMYALAPIFTSTSGKLPSMSGSTSSRVTTLINLPVTLTLVPSILAKFSTL